MDAHSSTQSLRQAGWVVLLLAFTSGFIIMSVELLGGRILAPYFGSSIYVWGSIISIFMVALSVGYLIGGRLSVLSPNLGRYGLFFLLAALGLLPIVFFANQAMDAVFAAIDDPRYGSLLASTLLFFIPTAILGMIAPYSVRLMVNNTDHSGQVAGGLYFVSTLGSALGTLLTSFYLVLWFDMNTILLAMITVLLLAGVLAIVLNRGRL
ncbi:MAG: glycosyl transferase [Gammaproteobacteria bacterium]|jgi:MFS family permease|nr:glycosyl transferase [Gammaproteobacteria bacterium]|tara:strand:+ start:1475 stop:2101 length:627 start_codon:yes stop_codon:yes gene_type:complete